MGKACAAMAYFFRSVGMDPMCAGARRTHPGWALIQAQRPGGWPCAQPGGRGYHRHQDGTDHEGNGCPYHVRHGILAGASEQVTTLHLKPNIGRRQQQDQRQLWQPDQDGSGSVPGFPGKTAGEVSSDGAREKQGGQPFARDSSHRGGVAKQYRDEHQRRGGCRH